MRDLLLNAKQQLQKTIKQKPRTDSSEDSSVFTEEEAFQFLNDLLETTDDGLLDLSSAIEIEPSKCTQPNELLDGAMIQEIVNIVSSDDLIKEMSQFINACTTGPLGSALVDVLDKLDSFDGLRDRPRLLLRPRDCDKDRARLAMDEPKFRARSSPLSWGLLSLSAAAPAALPLSLVPLSASVSWVRRRR